MEIDENREEARQAAREKIKQIIRKDDLDAFLTQEVESDFWIWCQVFKYNAAKIWKHLLTLGYRPITDGSDQFNRFGNCFSEALRNNRWDIIALSLPIMSLEIIQGWVATMIKDTILTSYLLTKGIPLYEHRDHLVTNVTEYELLADSTRSCLLVTVGFARNKINNRNEMIDDTWSAVLQHIDIAPSFITKYTLSPEEIEKCDLSMYDNTAPPLEAGTHYHTLLKVIDAKSTNWAKRLLLHRQLTSVQQQDVFERVWKTRSMKLLQLLRDKRIPPTINSYYQTMAQMVMEW
jgi:hypothetical protein